MKVLGVLHIADLFREPKYRIPSHRDWAKIPHILDGTWPKPIPPRFQVNDDTADKFSDWIEEAQKAEFVVADAEYHDHQTLTILGLGYPGMIEGCQFIWPSLSWWVKERVQLALVKLVTTTTMVYQNAIGAELPVFKQVFGITYDEHTRVDDTMIAHSILWPEWPHTLEFLASLYGPYPKLKHLAGSDPFLYNWGDVIDTIAVWEGLRREFALDRASWSLYDRIRGVMPIILQAHEAGIRVNKARVLPAAVSLDEKRTRAIHLAHAYAGFPLNVGSPKQLQTWLYQIEKLPEQKGKNAKHETKVTIAEGAITALRMARTPEPDLDEESRNGLTFKQVAQRVEEGAHPVLEARVLFAAAQQEMSHYIAPLFHTDEQLRDRIYPEHHVHAQANGRWSTVDPPMAQLPAALRDIVWPDPGEAWLGYDFDQIELRINAAISNDTPSLTAFARGWDIHTLNACTLFALPLPEDCLDPHYGEASKDWRQRVHWQGKDDVRRVFAKRFVYRMDYGGDPRGAGNIPGAKTLGMDPHRLIKAANDYLREHPNKAAWRRRVVANVSSPSRGAFPESRTFLGRRRILLASGNKRIRDAFDHPMQAAVSDIANLTAIALKAEMPWLRLVYQMYDGWWWACPHDKVEQTWPHLRSIVERTWDVQGVSTRFPATFKQQCEEHLDCFAKKRRPA